MLYFPNAKINLGLFVTEKRADGYHNLETVFYPLHQIKDALEIVPAAGAESTFSVKGMSEVLPREQNLVWKAYEMLRADFASKMYPVDIRLIKAIPQGAGLGGGSADAAFMLRLTDRFFELEVGGDKLAEYALRLGSDCPFFVFNKPKFAQGRGELFEEIKLDLHAFSWQVICPSVHVSTAEAFARITPKHASFDLRKLAVLPLEQWKEYVYNDFEESVFSAHPELRAWKEKLYAAGAIYASMSGSGSSLFGIFPKSETAPLSLPSEVRNFFIP